VDHELVEVVPVGARAHIAAGVIRVPFLKEEASISFREFYIPDLQARYRGIMVFLEVYCLRVSGGTLNSLATIEVFPLALVLQFVILFFGGAKWLVVLPMHHRILLDFVVN
jgi:hypothetical protein